MPSETTYERIVDCPICAAVTTATSDIKMPFHPHPDTGEDVVVGVVVGLSHFQESSYFWQKQESQRVVIL